MSPAPLQYASFTSAGTSTAPSMFAGTTASQTLGIALERLATSTRAFCATNVSAEIDTTRIIWPSLFEYFICIRPPGFGLEAGVARPPPQGISESQIGPAGTPAPQTFTPKKNNT